MFDSIPKRYIFICMGLLGTTMSIVLQTNLTLAIVYMVDRSNTSSTNSRASNECVAVNYIEDNDTYQIEHEQGRYEWNPETQGIILGAIYYGMIVGFIPGGRLAEIYGGKKTVMCGMLMASILTTLLPFAVDISVYALVAFRFIIGFGSATIFPVFCALMPQWIPIDERSFSSSIIYAGYGTGGFVAFLMTGVLCSSEFLGGWPSVFYSCGFVGIVYCILCYFWLFDSPESHPKIHLSEKEYIERNTESMTKKQIESIPWKAIMTSMPFWSLAIASFGQYWNMGFHVTSQPLYMGTILNLESAKNGYLSALPNLTRALFACIAGLYLDYICKKKKISNVLVRKGSTLLNSVIACLGYVAIHYTGCDPVLTTVCFVVGSLTGDFVTFGVNLAQIDIAPNLVGTISGIISAVATAPYFIVPSLIGEFTKHEQSMKQWSYIFDCTIGVIVLTTAVYMVFGTSNPQPWGTFDKERFWREMSAKEKPKKADESQKENGEQCPNCVSIRL